MHQPSGCHAKEKMKENTYYEYTAYKPCLCRRVRIYGHHWFSFMFVKLALIHANPLDTLAHRFTISFIAASLALLIARRKVPLDLKRSADHRAAGDILSVPVLTPQTFGLVYTSSAEAGSYTLRYRSLRCSWHHCFEGTLQLGTETVYRIVGDRDHLYIRAEGRFLRGSSTLGLY